MRRAIIFIGILLCTLSSKAQNVVELSVNNDTTICAGSSIPLQAYLMNAPSATQTYTVQGIGFNPDPFLSPNSVTLGDDDQTRALNIGFDFCFFGNSYQQFIIGSNGWISFSANQPNSWAGFTLPNSSGLVPQNVIMGPWQDLDPRWGGSISYAIYGNAPYRRLVVSYHQVPHYASGANGCGVTTTAQIKLFETSNVIEIHLLNKPICSAWNNGIAAEGIHNSTGTMAYVVPGRNNSTWAANGDAYAFLPNGFQSQNINWYANGQSIGTGASLIYTPTQSQTITAIAQFGCNNTLYDTARFNVSINQALVSVQQVKNISCNGLKDAILQANVNGGIPPYNYNWNTIPAQTTASITVGTGAYTVHLSDSLGCTATASINVSQPAKLSASPIVTIPPTCSYAKDGMITLSCAGGTAPYQYIWNTGLNAQHIDKLENGDYHVLVEDANHCKDSLDFHFNTPVLQVYAGLDYAIFAGESVHPEPLLNTTTPLTYSWTPEIDILGEHSLHPILTPQKSTNYTLTIQDMKGCKASDELTVTVKVLTDLPIYNAFTPNKDGNNDVFSLKMFNDKIQLEDFSIYNRYGQKIFATRSLQEGWDGTFKGEEQEIGTYIYEIRFLDANGDEHIKKGDIILMR